MIKSISCRIADYLVEKGADPAKREVYSYGLECLINYILSDLLLYTFAALFHQLPAVFVWSVSYTLLRTNIGGSHASTHAACIIFGTIIGMCSLFLNPLWMLSPILPVILLVLILVDIAALAPVVHVNHPVSSKNRKKAKRKALVITLLGFFAAYILYYYHIYLANAILSGFACALLFAFHASFMQLLKK